MQFSVLRLARRSFVVTLATASCGIGSLGVAAWAGEVSQNDPATVAPVEFGSAKTQGASTSVVTVDPELVAPVGFNLSNTARDVALEQIKAGTLTPEAAWQSGALTFDNIADLLENEADVYVIHFQGADRRFHHQLVELLLQHESARFDSLEKVPQRVRLWLADYYQSQGNEKAITVAESIVAEHQQPTKGSQAIVFQALERQAWFYQDQRKYELAAQAWKRVPSYVTNTEWMIPDAVWLTGRMYMRAGKPDVAEPYFAQVSASKNTFIQGMVLYDKATFLLEDGKAEEAEKLLVSELPIIVNPQDRIGPLWTLAQAQLKNNHYSQAKTSLVELTRHFQNPKNFMAGVGAEVIGPAAEAKLQMIEKWEGKAFELPLSTVLAQRDEKGVYHAKLYVHSLTPQDVTVGFAFDSGAQLVKLEQLRSQRTDAGVVVSLYDVAYQIVSHPNELKVQVSSKQAPSDQTQELRVRAPLPTE